LKSRKQNAEQKEPCGSFDFLFIHKVFHREGITCGKSRVIIIKTCGKNVYKLVE